MREFAGRKIVVARLKGRVLFRTRTARLKLHPDSGCMVEM
jgi:hypothetical protein